MTTYARHKEECENSTMMWRGIMRGLYIKERINEVHQTCRKLLFHGESDMIT